VLGPSVLALRHAGVNDDGEQPLDAQLLIKELADGLGLLNANVAHVWMHEEVNVGILAGPRGPLQELLEAQTAEKNTKFVKMLASMGHESPTEHVSFTFAIEGVSRSLLAQITRHPIASYSLQSQRYVRLDDFQFVIPPEIEADPASKELFLQAMKKQGEEYLSLAASLQERH
jgi:flavin-dependent thymidylate synthase